jgi:serpin B
VATLGKGSFVSRLVKIFVIGGLLTIAVVGLNFWQDSYRRESCDRSAQGDIAKMSAAIERLDNEVADMNCQRPRLTQKHMAFLVGPYYGWGGTSRKCEVRVRVQGDEALVCSVKGTSPQGGKNRCIYRANLTTLKPLPPTVGPCYGQEYGGSKAPCYISSMIGLDCSFAFTGLKRGPADAALVASCEATKEENKPREQAFTSLSDKSVNAFAAEFYGKTISKDSNMVFSPLGMFIPLAMAYAGARGDTKTQMEKVMRIDKFDGDVHSTLGALSKELKCAVIKGDGQLDVDSMVGAREGAGFTEEYKETIRTSYGIPFNQYGFGKRTETPEQESQTRSKKSRPDEVMQRITEGVQNQDTNLMLVNEIYFRGLWKPELKFDEKDTKLAPFFLLDGNQIEASTMFKEGMFKYLEEGDFQALEIPYQGEEVSMVVFLPREKKGLPAFEKRITQEKLSQWMSRLEVWQYGVKVFLPKFIISLELDLIPPLKSMGMKDAFFSGWKSLGSGKNADFSGMTGKRADPNVADPLRDLFISDARQQVWIEVNEEGSEAFARTMLCMQITGADGDPAPEPKPKIFQADHPFVFVIRHIPTNCILFMGRLTVPL